MREAPHVSRRCVARPGRRATSRDSRRTFKWPSPILAGMAHDPDLVDFLLVRSRLRVQVLLALRLLGPASAREIARHVQARPERVRAALIGWRKQYSTERSLLAGGLVTADIRRGALFRLTPEGARVGAELARKWTENPGPAAEDRLFAYVRRARETRAQNVDVPRPDSR